MVLTRMDEVQVDERIFIGDTLGSITLTPPEFIQSPVFIYQSPDFYFECSSQSSVRPRALFQPRRNTALFSESS